METSIQYLKYFLIALLFAFVVYKVFTLSSAATERHKSQNVSAHYHLAV